LWGFQGAVYHKDATGWSAVPAATTLASYSDFHGVYARAANEIWLVGGVILYWDGSQNAFSATSSAPTRPI
jgi:hypothetical protein